MEYAWNDATSTLSSETKSVTEYTVVASDSTAWSDGWYVVNDTVTVEGDITVNGNVHLLLTDGYKLTVTGNVSFASGNSLTVYGQEQGTGALTVEGGMANGSSSSQNGGNGGSGSTWTGGNGGNGNIVTVSGGKVTVGGSIVNVGSGHTGGAGAAGTATGIIYKDNVGTVYGNNVTLQNDTEIPAGATLIVPAGVNLTVPAGVNFTIPAGASMTVNGMLNLGGTVTNSGTLALQSNEQLSGTGTLSGNGMWQILNITTDVISVPADRVYDGTDWTDDAKAAIALPTDAGTICGKAFTYNTDGWAYTLSPETVLNAETYTVTYSKTDFSDVTKTFEVTPAPLTVTAVLPETWWGEAPTIEDVAISGTLYSTDTVEVTGLTVAPASAADIGDSVPFNVDGADAVYSGSGYTNYDITVATTSTGKVKVIPLTISGVTMDADAYTYGDPVGYDNTGLTITQPGGTAAKAEDLLYTYTGTANDSTEWNSAEAPTKAGSYMLTVSHKDTVHYSGKLEISFTIERKSVTITAHNQRYRLGTKLPETIEAGKHYTIEGLLGNDSIGTVTVKYQQDDVDVTPNIQNTDKYDIIPVVSNANANYAITYVNAELTYYRKAIKTYTPAIEETEGGKVILRDMEAAKGQTMTITLKPDAGMLADTVTVTEEDGNSIAVTDNGDGTYSFKQPAEKVVIKATFKPKARPAEAYADLATDAWYYESVDYVLSKGLMQGVGTSKFDPSGSTTRAMIVTTLWRLEGEPVVNYAMAFADVKADAWYAEAVRWAACEGLVRGYSAEEFCPDTAITREQMAAIIYRYAAYKGTAPTGAWAIRLAYADVANIADYAIEAVMYCTMKNLMQGRDGDMFAPQATASRAEIAVILHRFIVNSK